MIKLFDLCKNSIIQIPNIDIVKDRLIHLQQIHEESKQMNTKIALLLKGFSTNEKMLKEAFSENAKVKEIFVKDICSMNSNLEDLVLKIRALQFKNLM